MIKKLINLFFSIIKGDVVLDYYAIGIKRERIFSIPKFTNYIRIHNLELVAQEIKEKGLKGAIAEVGVYKGEFAKYLNIAFPEKKLYLFDTFEGFDSNDVSIENEKSFSTADQDFSNTSINEVLSKMKFKNNCIIKQGYFPESLDGIEETFSFVSLDADLYKPIKDGLIYFYPRLEKGGFIFIHDYNNDLYRGAKQAVREFAEEYGVSYTPLPDTWGTVAITK
jgi:O-methyltransferase